MTPFRTVIFARRSLSLTDNTEESFHLVIEESLTWAVRLDPFAVEDELGDGSFAGVGDDKIGRAGGRLDVDFFVGNVVGGEEALGLAAVAAPGG